MNWQSVVTLATVVLAFVGIQRRWGTTDLMFLGALSLLSLLGILSVEQALSGFANPAVVMVGAMLVVGAGMRSTGALDWVGQHLLGSVEDDRGVLRRLSLVVTSLSALVNNTTIVAMFTPVIVHWCRRRNVSPSKLLIPLSYLAILGGVCTLIGTSTNVTVNGLLAAEQAKGQAAAGNADTKYTPEVVHELRPMTFFEIGYAGIPCAAIGALYLVLFSRSRLPDRAELLEKLGDERREYLVEMLVQPECRLIGQTVEAAGLRHLHGLFLIEIDRDGDLIAPVSPDDVIHSGDRLVFTGVVTTIVDLERIPGLVPAADLTYEVNPSQRSRRHLTEAVISNSSPLIGKTIRDANFRQLYNAAVIAVHRNGERLAGKLGDIRLAPGDTLLLQTRQHFAQAFRNNADFLLVGSVAGSEHGRYDRAWLAFMLLALLVLLLLLGTLFETFQVPAGVLNSAGFPAIAALVIAGLMVASRCVSTAEARSSIDLEILLTIAAGIGLGQAMDSSGLAKTVAEVTTTVAGSAGPYVLLTVLYLVTVVVTEALSNNAAAALMFPLGVALALQGEYSPRPFVMAICIAASAGFISPIGYQTNLMVMGPGAYRPSDYVRAGLPLSALVMLTALVVVPIVWPF